MPDATVAASPAAGFTRADLTTFCRLDELGLEVTGQRLEPGRAVLACRVLEPGQWCRRCGCEGLVRDTVIRQLAHEPLGGRPTTLAVAIRRYRCAECSQVWRQDTTLAAEPRAKLSRRGLRWALGGHGFDLVMPELTGLPGAPVRAAEVPGQALPAAVLEGNGNGTVAGTPPVYEFTMDNAVTLVPDATQLQDGFQRDIVHAVIVGLVGRIVTTKDGSQAFRPNTGTPAQQAVVNGLLTAIGSQPYPAGEANGPSAQQFRRQQAQIAAAADRFAALPAATRHAWLAANLAALKAGHITLAQIP
jgi:hypothetical protein